MWVVGIDEAGYGPNLGPLVQAAVALHLPDADPAGWDTLKGVVRRCHEPADDRLLIDDSKKVYTGGGVEALERAVSILGPISADVAELARKLTGITRCAELTAEAWYDGAERLPLTRTPEEWWAEFVGFGTRAEGVPFKVLMEALLVQPPAFNRHCDEAGSKGAVLGRGFVELAAGVTETLGKAVEGRADPIQFLCDKHGGRNFYAAMVQQAFPDGWVVAEKEGATESRYRVDGLGRAVTVTFRPRADGDSVAVALASMVCKYLREVCMRQFNRFWQLHVPGLEPTAGYPNDAKRFYAAIRPAMAKLGLTADQVWRKR